MYKQKNLLPWLLPKSESDFKYSKLSFTNLLVFAESYWVGEK